jgi:salicylate hydroxylase
MYLQDTANTRVTLENGNILQADLIVAADGVHSTAVNYVLDESVRAKDTGWAVMRWLVPTEDLLSDPQTAHMVENNSARLYIVRTGKTNMMWYPCRKCVVSSVHRYMATR